MTEIKKRSADTFVHEKVYQALRQDLIAGRIRKGDTLTLRGIASRLDVSPMPVRDAIRRLSAERALEVQNNRRVRVPPMTSQRLDDLRRARLILEPMVARMAQPHIDQKTIHLLEEIDELVDKALEIGDVDLYMKQNFTFHFTIYGARPSSVFPPLLESLWMQFGPHMGDVYEKVNKTSFVDQHRAAIASLKEANSEKLEKAIRLDISAGMDMLESVL